MRKRKIKIKRLSKKQTDFHDINVELVLERLGIENQKKGKELFAKCPSPKHDDKNPSWSICSQIGNAKNGLFLCWSCGWKGNIFSLVESMLRCSRHEVKIFIDACRVVKTPLSIVDNEYSYYPKQIDYGDFGIEPDRVLSVAAKRYLKSRGIGKLEIKHFGLLDDRKNKRVIVPITIDGNLISWVARTYVGAKPKVKVPKGVKKCWDLFGYDFLDRDKLIHLCEGWADAIRLWQAGKKNVVALNGARVYEQQVELLAWVNKIVVWADGDFSGKRLVRNVKRWFTWAEVFVVQMPDGSDPNDRTVLQIVADDILSFNEWSLKY